MIFEFSDKLFISILAGILPIAIFFIKELLIKKEIVKPRVVTVKSSSGKVSNILMEGKLDKEKIKKIILEEFTLEDKVEKILKNYKSKHKNFDFIRNQYVDFLIKNNEKTFGLEVKTSKSTPLKNDYETVTKAHPEISELIFLFNSDIPEDYLNKYKENKKITFISTPREKGISDKVYNVLDNKLASKA